MRLLHRTGPGALGLNYMWLPTFVGMNTALIKRIEEHVSPLLVGQAITDELLEQADHLIIKFLENEFPNIRGIFDYLDGLKYVEADAETQKEQHRALESSPS